MHRRVIKYSSAAGSWNFQVDRQKQRRKLRPMQVTLVEGPLGPSSEALSTTFHAAATDITRQPATSMHSESAQMIQTPRTQQRQHPPLQITHQAHVCGGKLWDYCVENSES